MKHSNHKAKDSQIVDLRDKNATVNFRKAARAFTRKATRTADDANNVLVREGIITDKGNLTKHYR